MAERASALDGHYQTGRFGAEGDTGVSLTLIRDLNLQQVASWADSFGAVESDLIAQCGVSGAPGPCRSATGESGSVLRIEPLKWWLVDAGKMEIDSEQGAAVDLSHSRTRIRVNGNKATTLLNRLLPKINRQQSFPEGSVASSAMHHIGVTLWRSSTGYELFIPRGFALSAWEVLLDSAEQFGVEVC